MTEFNYKYGNLVERREQIAIAEGSGLRMLHDNFNDPKWKHGNPQVGTMIFTDEPETPPEPVTPVRDLAAEIDGLEERIERLETG
ncbi:hypothetical protein ES703_95989 [subsurface metagenome]